MEKPMDDCRYEERSFVVADVVIKDGQTEQSNRHDAQHAPASSSGG
jgi:hypothetical protein